MSKRKPRLAIIPAGAVTDARLTPRALQVLCLLGRHTDDNGWCRVRQTRMADELGCARSTIQVALDVLYETMWVERRLEGRPGASDPDPDKQPYASHAYRVILDPPEVDEPPSSASGVDGGCPENRAPGVPDQPGTTCPTDRAPGADPYIGTNERPFNNDSEREGARAREKRATGLLAFEQRWPTAAADDRNRTAYAWEALTDEDREAALAGIAPFLDNLKRHKRSHPPAGWKYLEQKRWQMIEAKAAEQATQRPLSVPADGPEGRAFANLCAVGRAVKPLKFSGCYVLQRPLTPQELAFADVPPETEWVFLASGHDVQNIGAWNEFIAAALRNVARGEMFIDRKADDGAIQRGIRVPWPWPPRKDGSLCTGPPD